MATRLGPGIPVQYAPRSGELPTLASTPDGVVAVIGSGLPLVLDARVETQMVQLYESALSKPPEPALVLEYDLSVVSFEPGARPQVLWQGHLFAGAVADVYEVRGFGTIHGTYATLVTPEGNREYVGGGLGNTMPNQLFDDPPAWLGENAAKAGAEFGLQDVQVSTVRAIQPSVVLIATTDTPTESVNADSGAHSTSCSAALEGTSKAITSSYATPPARSSTPPAQPAAQVHAAGMSTHPSESKADASSRWHLAKPIVVQGSFRNTGPAESPGRSVQLLGKCVEEVSRLALRADRP
jgi:hypothetical protein